MSFFLSKKTTTEVPTVPEATKPGEEPIKVFYRLGVTDNNRITLQIGYSEISMNRKGCQDLIDNLTFFMNQLEEEGKDET